MPILMFEISDDDYEWIKTHPNTTDYKTTLMLYEKVRSCDAIPDDICGKRFHIERKEEN